jgi:hypothetical protein
MVRAMRSPRRRVRHGGACRDMVTCLGCRYRQRSATVDRGTQADAAARMPRSHGLAEAEIVELQGREQHRGRVEAKAVDDIGPQRFSRFGAIRNPGIKRVHRQPGARVEFGPFVRVHEVARIRLEEHQEGCSAVDNEDSAIHWPCRSLVAQV